MQSQTTLIYKRKNHFLTYSITVQPVHIHLVRDVGRCYFHAMFVDWSLFYYSKQPDQGLVLLCRHYLWYPGISEIVYKHLQISQIRVVVISASTSRVRDKVNMMPGFVIDPIKAVIWLKYCKKRRKIQLKQIQAQTTVKIWQIYNVSNTLSSAFTLFI